MAHYRSKIILAGFLIFNTLYNPVSAQNQVLRRDNLPVITTAQKGRLKFIDDNYFGLNVQNFSGDFIGMPYSKKAPWIPLFGGYRSTLTGKFQRFFTEDVHSDQNEYDWNIRIQADGVFRQGAYRQESYVIECEVTPDPQLRRTSLFPPPRSYAPYNRKMCLYGPYVSDWGNDNGREIHPVEAVWWQTANDNNDVTIILVQDATVNRFHEVNDFDLDINNDFVDDTLPGWKVWVENPMKQTIKIPFEYDFSNGKHLVVEVTQIQQANVTTILYPELRDRTTGTANHKLQISLLPNSVSSPLETPYTVAEITKTGDAINFIGVRFIEVTKSADNKKIYGYIQLLTALGRVGANDPYGHQIIQIKKKFITETRLPPANN